MDETVFYGDAPSVLIFADQAERRSALSTAVHAMGGRVAAALTIGEGADRLAQQIAIDAVVVEADHAGPPFEALIGAIDGTLSGQPYPCVVSVAPDLVDLAFARMRRSNIALLCNPSVLEQASAIGTALSERRLHLGDSSADAVVPRLQQISEEVGRIARALANMTDVDAKRTPPLPPATPTEYRVSTPTSDAAQVRAIIRARRMRDQFFDRELFADPGWDILLDLMAARLEGQQVAVSSLCIAAAVPPTTALRWIKALTEQGVLLRVADPTDGRRVFITLSDAAAEGMATYLAAAQRLGVVAS